MSKTNTTITEEWQIPRVFVIDKKALHLELGNVAFLKNSMALEKNTSVLL